MSETPQVPPPDDIPVVSSPLELFVDEQDRVIVGRGGGLHDSHPNAGLAYIGRVYEQTREGSQKYTLKPIMLDIAQPHRVFISGKSGSGKSYTLGVLIEEIQKAQMGVACVVVDIMGVFTASKEPNHDPREIESLNNWELLPEGVSKVKIFVPAGFTPQIPRNLYDEPFSFKPDDLELDDWLYTFNINFNSAMGLCLSEVMNFAKKHYPHGFSIPDIINVIQNNPHITDPEKGFALTSRKALVSKLLAAEHWGIFSQQGTNLSQFCQRDTCAILDVSPLSENLRGLVTGILARKILEARRRIARGGEVAMEDRIPITWIVVDEAHNFAPAKGTTPALEALVRLAKEGRHPGVNLVLATQQPGATSNEIISQCDVLITHNLSYDEDIKTFKAKAPCEVPKEMIDSRFIRSMAVGVGILAVQSMKISRAFMVRIRPRQSQHGGKELLPTGLGKRLEEQPPIESNAGGLGNSGEREEKTSPESSSTVEEGQFKTEQDFYPDKEITTSEEPSMSITNVFTELKGTPALNLSEDLAEDVVERALTYDDFFPKTGPFDSQTARYHAAPDALVRKAVEILDKSNYCVKAKTHESGAWLLFGEHNEVAHSILFAVTSVSDQLITAFKASQLPKAPPEGVISLKKFVKMLDVGF
ncbi:MAG: hypothetical protein RBG13Loki_1017 [Promethearchaeota archaeon CR_4]|nr:MAG: hypothetical protein RBG13Loki_1017 [Candidatus Lokiarchaeota archaeon CR_4]